MACPRRVPTSTAVPLCSAARFAELEASLGEVRRARAVFELSIAQPMLDMPEMLWKKYIDFEIDQAKQGPGDDEDEDHDDEDEDDDGQGAKGEAEEKKKEDSIPGARARELYVPCRPSRDCSSDGFWHSRLVHVHGTLPGRRMRSFQSLKCSSVHFVHGI